MEDNKRKLYDALSEDYDLGSFEQFSADVADETKRRKLYDAAIEDYDFGDFDSFSSQLGFGKAEQPSRPSVSEPEDVPDNFDDVPDLRPLNEKARKSAEKEQKRVAKEEEKARKEAQKSASAGRKSYGAMSPQERRKAFNEQFKNRQQELAQANPEAWEAEKELIEENNELGRQAAKEEKQFREDVKRFGAGNESYSPEEAVSVGKEFEAIAPDIESFDTRLAAFNNKSELVNSGRLQLTPDEYKEMQNEADALTGIVQKYDEVMNTAPGKEYKEIAERMETIAKGEKTPDSAWEYAKEFSRLQSNPIYRASLGQMAPSDDEIQSNLLQGQIAYLEGKMKDAKGDEKKALKKAYSEAKEALYANPYYKEHIATKIAENKAENEQIAPLMAERRAQLNAQYREQGLPIENYWQYEQTDPELQNFVAASKMHDDAIREYEKPTKYGDKGVKNVGKGLSDWAGSPDTWFGGLESFRENISTVRPVLEKVQGLVGNLNEDELMTDGNLKMLEENLTPGELAVLDAYFEKVGAQAAKGADTSIGYQIGQGIGDMVSLGVEMALTGGVGGAVHKSIDKAGMAMMKKLLSKRAYAKFAKSGVGRVALWGTHKIGRDIAETAVRIPFMPSTYKALGEGSVELSSDYKVRPLTEYAPEKLFDQYVEQLTEVSNGFGLPVINRVVKTPGISKFVHGMLGENGTRALKAFIERGDIKLLDDAMIGSFGGEWEEELLGAVIHSVTDDPTALQDFFSAEQQLVLLGTLAPIPLVRGTAGGVQLGVPAAKAGIAWNRAEKALIDAGLDEGRIARLKEVMDNAPATEAARAVMEAYNDAFEGFMAIEEQNGIVRGTVKETGANWKEKAGGLYDKLAHYYWAAQQKRAVGLMAEVEEDKKIADKQAELETRLGGKFYKEENGGNVVEVATMLDAAGNPTEVFITSTEPNSNGEMAYVPANGGPGGFVTFDKLVSAMPDGTYTPSGQTLVTPLNEYLAGLVMRDSQIEEAASVAEDVSTVNRSVRELVEQLPEIKFDGKTGTLRAANDDMVTFVPDDENEESIIVSWETLAEQNGIQTPEVQTQDEKTIEDADAVAAHEQAKADIYDAVNDAINGGFDEAVIDTEDGPAHVIGILQDTIDPENGTAQFTVQLPDGSRDVTTQIPIDPILAQLRGEETAEAETEEPAEEPETTEEEPEEETVEIPLDKDGNPIYDAPGVSVEDALEAIYTTDGVSEEMGDQFILEEAEKAEKNRNPKRGKMTLAEWGKATQEANRIADFWAQLKSFAEENKNAREAEQKREAERQALIEKYGVDTSNFDLTPQNVEEAVANYLANSEKVINLADAIRETLGRRKDNRIPTELFRHLGAHGILTKNGGSSIQRIADDVTRDFYGDIEHDEEANDARDYIISFLTNNTKSEIRDFIFNNRLDEARKIAEQVGAEEEITGESFDTEKSDITEPAPEEPAAEEPEVKEPEEAPEDLPEETAEEPQAEEPAEETTETPENKPEEGRKSGEKSVTSQEEVTAPEATPESTYGSDNKVISREQYEELRKRFLDKTKGQLNAGFDPELFSIGVQMAAFHIEAGARKFIEFAKNIINDLGDAIRPYLKSIYNGARDLPGMEEIKKDMTPADEVDKIDINADFNTLSDEQSTDSLRDDAGRDSAPVSDGDEGGVGEEQGESDVPTDTGTSGEDSEGRGDGADSGDNSGGEEEGRPENDSTDSGNADGEVASGSNGGRGRKANGTRGRGGKRGGADGRGRGGRRSGETERGESGDTESDVSGDVTEETGTKENPEETRETAKSEKEKTVNEETDTEKLESEKDNLKEKLSDLSEGDETAAERAKLAGELEAVINRLRELYKDAPKKLESLAQEKVPYVSVSDPAGDYCIGSVVPSGVADAMHEAALRIEREIGKPLAEFVREELGYESLEDMFTRDGKDVGLAAEQVDATALAIYQMKQGRMLINGDMTGIGKGRVGAALIRWAVRNGKKCIFATDKPGLFSDMYRDITDIGSGYKSDKDPGLLPFIINDKDPGNKNKTVTIIDNEKKEKVKSPSKTVKAKVFEGDGSLLPKVGESIDRERSGPKGGPQIRGKQYDFVMMTYSQAQSARGTFAKNKLDWLKSYAKDAIIICDESHLAAGDSTRGSYFQDMVKACGGVTFMSATFAKNPECMALYAIRSSMSDARMSNQAFIETVKNYGVPMQEFLAQTLMKSGEMVRRERDFTGVETTWTDPKELYSEEEYRSCRETNDKTVSLIRDIIQFQRSFIDPIIKKMNEGFKAANRASEERGEGWFLSYTNTAYSSQVSNICNLMFYAMKAKKAADVAIEKMKKGEKAIIVVDNTLEGYIKEIEGIVTSPDFSAVFDKGAKNILKYRFNKKWKKLDREASEEKGEPVWVEDEEKAEVQEYESIRSQFEATDEVAYKDLLQRIKDYSADKTLTRLSISPIDYIKELIQDAGFSCGEITGREVQLVRRDDGTYVRDKRDNERKDTEYRFNGGTAENPLPANEQYDAVILNSAAATGISLHASRRFGNQAKRNMVIVQPAKDQNVEVQVRGRNDRTGQVQRGAYYYITSPIPAEFKTVMMLRKKLASLDAQASGTANVSSNKVDADDMDNKYGDEVARDFLAEHPEINYQLDKPILPERDPKTGEMIYKVRDGLLYKLLIGMQRMTCAEQEMILGSLQEQYIELVEYYEQNGTNELSSSVLDLEAVTIDEGVFVHGKDNSSISGFAHDTKLERVEVNVLKKPMLSSQIYDNMRKLGVFNEEGKIDPSYGDNRVLAPSKEYVKNKKDELDKKHEEELGELLDTLMEANPQPEDMTEQEWRESILKMEPVIEMRDRHNREKMTVGENLDIQVARVEYSVNNLKPGALMMVPLIDGAADSVPYGPGRFIGFKTSKDGNPKSVKAVFATKDSRSQISFPVVKMKDMITGIIHHTNDSGDLYETNLRDIGGWRDDKNITDEDRRKDRDTWWDKRVPKKGRSIRYIITGNLFQAGFNIGTQKKQDKYGYSQKEENVRGKMCLFTRKDPETGRITVEQGMLLVDSFDPETFYVSDVVKKPDVWDSGDAIRDKKSSITVFRSGNNLVIQFGKRKNERMANHPVLKDETIMGMMNEEKFTRKKEYIECTIPDAKVDDALDHLYKEYGFTKDRLFIMPDSTERVDAIVPDTRPYQDIIKEMKAKYPYYDYVNEVEYELTRLIARYKADIENEDVIAQIKDFVAYRQALYRREYAREDTGRLAWFALMKQDEFERNTENKSAREKAFNELEAIKVEMASRLGDIANSGTQKHYKQGRHTLKEVEDIFKEFNKDKFNKEMAEKVFKKFKGIKEANIPILFSDKIDSGTGGFSQGQKVEYNWKFFNSEWIPDYLKSNTVLHELVHTLTVYAKYSIDQGYGYLLNDDVKALVNELSSIFRAIRWDNSFQHETYQDYGTKNWEEMLAEAASNDVFREDLKKVQLIKTVRDGDASFSRVQAGMDTAGKKVVSAYDAVIERLNDLIDSFSETALIEIYRGTGSGEMYRRGSAENLMSPIDRARAISSVTDLARKLGVKFKMDSSLDGKGAFNPQTGQIRINIDAHEGTEDLQATLLHEAVAHYGLRKLLGKDFSNELKNIYNDVAPSIREKIDEIAKRDGLTTEVATEEYLAQLAEDGRFDAAEEDFWQRVWYGIHQLLRKLGFKTHLTDADMRALLYASYRNLQTRGAVAQAHHITVYNALRKQAELSREEDNGPEDDGPNFDNPGTYDDETERSGQDDNGVAGDEGSDVQVWDSETESGAEGEGINDLPEEVKRQAIDNETSELYRQSRSNATAQTAAEMYGQNVRTIGNAIKEVLVDEYAPVDKLMEALESESGKKIKDDERVSDMMRETGGKAMDAIRQYNDKFLEPMWSAVGEFRKNTGSSIKDTETYVGLKSGLERNVVLAKRDAKRDYQAAYDAEVEKIDKEENDKKKALDKQLKNGKISDVTYAGEITLLQQEMKQKRDDALAKRDAHFADVDAGTDERFKEYRKKDYSAITAWAETDDLEEAERLAGDYVSDMESRAGADATKEMWKRINAATKETLKFQYEHQILSKQQYADISKMMQYYVPMRGFAEDTAEDLYNYYVTAQSNDFQATVLTAKGRKTMYEGPLGNIGAMHSSAISQGVKNEAKLSLLDAVRRRRDNTIATVTRAWFVKNGQKDENGKDIYEVAYPQVPEGATLQERQDIIEQFEEDMAEAKRNGDAYNAHREVDLHGGVVAFEREAHKNEHIVTVREGGKEYGIIINGNPAAAQAINGVRRGNGAGEKFLGIMRNWTRFLSSMFTTFSIPFWVSNFQRDHGQGLTNAFIRNNPEYVGKYIVNRMKAAKLFPLILGKETMDNALAKGDPVAVLYQQYLENGGPMGQNRIEDNEYFERKMKRYLDNSAKQGVIKGATAVLDVIGGIGEAIETITRFATFMTSMESGRSIHESISDAKEISTNFARKGSGRSFSRSELDRMTHADGRKLTTLEKNFVNATSIGVEICRAAIPFFNAAVQGLENKVTNYREHAGKTLLADSIYLMLGLGMKLLLGNAGGDDDKEKYSHTSDYVRRNNILNPLGNGIYAKWALPQEYRVMYAMGDILGSALQQERPIEDLGADAFGALMQLSPIGAVTDEVAFSPENKKKAYETLITNISPGVFAPVLESIFNMDFKGARIYNEGFNENLRSYPGWTKALPTTGKEYVAAAKFLNELTGGNDVERGWVNINPAIVEHLVESYFSGPYQIVARVPEAIEKGVKGEATVRDIPLLNRIILNSNDNQRDAFYSNMYYYFKEENTEAERIHTNYKNRPKEGQVADFYKSKEYKYMLVFNKYDKIESQLRKASKKANEKGDKEAKKNYDDKLQEVQYKIAKECLDIYFDRKGVK